MGDLDNISVGLVSGDTSQGSLPDDVYQKLMNAPVGETVTATDLTNPDLSGVGKVTGWDWGAGKIAFDNGTTANILSPSWNSDIKALYEKYQGDLLDPDNIYGGRAPLSQEQQYDFAKELAGLYPDSDISKAFSTISITPTGEYNNEKEIMNYDFSKWNDMMGGMQAGRMDPTGNYLPTAAQNAITNYKIDTYTGNDDPLSRLGAWFGDDVMPFVARAAPAIVGNLAFGPVGGAVMGGLSNAAIALTEDEDPWASGALGAIGGYVGGQLAGATGMADYSALGSGATEAMSSANNLLTPAVSAVKEAASPVTSTLSDAISGVKDYVTDAASSLYDTVSGGTTMEAYQAALDKEIADLAAQGAYGGGLPGDYPITYASPETASIPGITDLSSAVAEQMNNEAAQNMANQGLGDYWNAAESSNGYPYTEATYWNAGEGGASYPYGEDLPADYWNPFETSADYPAEPSADYWNPFETSGNYQEASPGMPDLASTGYNMADFGKLAKTLLPYLSKLFAGTPATALQESGSGSGGGGVAMDMLTPALAGNAGPGAGMNNKTLLADLLMNPLFLNEMSKFNSKNYYV